VGVGDARRKQHAEGVQDEREPDAPKRNLERFRTSTETAFSREWPIG
jgi:hypothetical protein